MSTATGAGAHQRRRTHPARRRQHGSGAGLYGAGEAGGGGQDARRLAVPGAGAWRVEGQDLAVRGRGADGSADRGAVARVVPVRHDDLHVARPGDAGRRSCSTGSSPDGDRRSAAGGAPQRVAGVRPALCVRSGGEQAPRALPRPQSAERAGEREADRAGRGPAPARWR